MKKIEPISKESVAKKIKEFRDRNGWSQQYLAEEYLGIPLYTLQRWEAQKVNISPIMLVHLKRMKVI